MTPEHRQTIIKTEWKSKGDQGITDVKILREAMACITLKDETREKVARLQQEKGMVMQWLKEQIERVKKGERIELGERRQITYPVKCREGSLFAIHEGGEIPLTLGEMLTDISWGIDYELDSASVPKNIAKEYVLSRAKARLRELLNQQLLLIELEVGTDEGQRKSFQAITDRQKTERPLIGQDDGFIAEAMTSNLLKKLTIDHQLPISVEEGDVFDDVVNKIDYVISRKRYSRGIGVRADQQSEANSVGIQFTLMVRKDAMIGKRETVLQALRRGIIGEQNVEDIVLVNIHPSYIKKAVNKWKKKKLPGGPDSCLETAAKVDFMQKVLQSLFSPEEIKQIVLQLYGVDRKNVKTLKTY